VPEKCWMRETRRTSSQSTYRSGCRIARVQAGAARSGSCVRSSEPGSRACSRSHRARPLRVPRRKHSGAARNLGRRQSVAKQAFQIFGKIIEIDSLLRGRAELAGRVFECHPELSFWAMNGNAPIAEPKNVKGTPYGPGLELRRRLLLAQGFEGDALEASVARDCGAGLDDLIDACAAAWTATRIARGEAISFPDPPERDAFGLPIAIWV